MKKIAVSIVLIFSIYSYAELPNGGMVSKIDNLYSPKGFDDNDIVELVLASHFPNACYQLGETLVDVDHTEKTIVLTPVSYLRADDVCIQMISPYSQVVRLGKMEAGEYKLLVTNNPNLHEKLIVKSAHAIEQDDFLYPPVEYADVESGSGGSQILVIKGRYPLLKRGCMRTTSAQIDFQDGNILVVQPNAVVDLEPTSGQACKQSYEKKYNLPFNPQGETLLHVRSINGQSYNRVVGLETAGLKD